MNRSRHFPPGPLLDELSRRHITPSRLARRHGIKLIRPGRPYLTEGVIDRACLAIGTMPQDVYPDWYDSTPVTGTPDGQ